MEETLEEVLGGYEAWSSEEDEDLSVRSPSMVGSSLSQSQVEEPISFTPVISSNPRCIYLVTYSRADALKVQSRKQFAEIVCAEFQRPVDGNNKIVSKWACAAEIHPNTDGFHYHLCIHLNRQRRFKQVALNLNIKHGICVDFQP